MVLPMMMEGGKIPYANRVKALFGSNLIGYWQMGESPAGNAYLTCNGATTQVNAQSDASLDDLADAEMTVDLWVKLSSATPYIIGKGTAGSTGWLIYSATNSRLRAEVECATTDANSYTSNNSFVRDGTWHHIAMYFNDAGDRKVYIAIDGVWETSYSAQTAGVDAIVSDAASNLLFPFTPSSFDDGDAIGWVRISNNDKLGNGVDFTAPSRTTIPTVDANTVSLWPMNEGYGSVAGDIGTNDNDGTISNGDWGAYPTAVDSSPEGNDGSYTGVTLANTTAPGGIGGSAPLFDGVNDFNNIYSAGLNTDFDGAEGSLLIWGKVSGAGVWTDTTTRNFARIQVTSSNKIDLFKDNQATSRIWCQYVAGATTENIIIAAATHGSPTGWFQLGITWSASAGADGEVKAYLNGAQTGSTATALGTWAGDLNSGNCNIGAGATAPDNVWDGWLAHAVLLDRVATPTEIANVYNRAGV